MKITRRQLKRIIKEELDLLNEGQSLGLTVRQDLEDFDQLGDPSRDVFSNAHSEMSELICDLQSKNDEAGLKDVRSDWEHTINTHHNRGAGELSDATRQAAHEALDILFSTQCG